MQKLSTIALLGAANAAVTPGPAVNSAFPQFASLHTVVGTDKDGTSGGMLVAFSQLSTALTGTASTVRGYRNNLFAFPTQNIVKASGDAAHATIAIPVSSATRTFYQTVLTQIGVSAPHYAAASGSRVNNQDGPTWVVCEAVTADFLCNSGVSYKVTGTEQSGIVARVSAKASATAAFTIGTIAASNLFLYNTDLHLASLYHNSAVTATPITDGTAWCSQHENKILKDGTMVPFSATYGLTGRTKCTWQLIAEDNTVGPAFQIKTSATYLGFYAHWVEWAGSAALASGMTLSATNIADFNLGAYPVGGNGAVWLNPALSQTKAFTTWAFSPMKYTASLADPNLSLPGTIGSVTYYPGYAGDAKEVQMTTMDSMQVQSMYDTKTAENAAFNSLNSAYEGKRTTYDDALTAETTRLADALKAAFEPMISIPTRPCAPVRPSAYDSVFLQLDSATAFGTTRTLAGWRGNLVQTLGTGDTANDTKVAVVSVHKGYIYPTMDTTATAALGEAGHIFGRLGQGTMTLPGAMAPFAWFPPAATSLATIQVSFFPALDTDSGLTAAAQVITCEAKAQAFAALSSFGPPAQPAEAVAATAVGASFLALGAASALVLATLI